MGNMHCYDKEIGEHNQKFKIFEYTEKCKHCKKGQMVHNALYTYTCNLCGYSYTVAPTEPKGKPVREKFINEE